MALGLVFVHGIGGPRRVEDDQRCWISALAYGARRAGHSAAAQALEDGELAHTVFAYYGSLFFPAQAQGGGISLDGNEAQMLVEFLAEIIERLSDDPEATEQPGVDQQSLAHALAKLRPQGQPQGSGEPVRRAIDAATTLLDAGPWRKAGQWVSGKVLTGALAQVPRYLGRGETDEDGRTLDERVRALVAASLGPGPAVVVAHSLGTVVSYETLHEHSGDVPLWVTLGSPLGMRSVVWPKLQPTPPATPPTVRRWLNFWDRDDIIVAKPDLERKMIPNAANVRPDSSRVDSDGVWVHDAVKYLAHPDVAGPVIEALQTGQVTG